MLASLALAPAAVRVLPASAPAPVGGPFASESALTATAPLPAAASADDRKALDEMLLGSKHQLERWQRTPELLVLGSVMQYHVEPGSEYVATSDRLSDEELDGMVQDLTAALGTLSGHAIEAFAAVHVETPAAGAETRITRPGQIVVGRYRGVRKMVDSLGFGGRTSQPNGTITAAAILLDDDFDRTDAARWLLRTHELGHALGYNHVVSRVSIMNPRIGPEPTAFDRQAALVAFGPARPQ